MATTTAMTFAVTGLASSTVDLSAKNRIVSITHVVPPTIVNLTSSRCRKAVSR